MKVIGMTLILATALLVAGCGEAERMETELAAANARIHALDSTLAEVRATSMMESAQVYNLTQEMRTMERERDDLRASLSSTKAQVGRLNTDLRRARVEYQSALDSLKGIHAALALDLNTLKSELENAEITIVSSERRTNDLIRARDSLYAFVDDVRPWYDYYKHEAQRNWLKKLFGAGDAVRPEGTEPEFGTGTTGDPLEASR